MTITTALCNSFKGELLQEGHNLASDTLKIALIKTSDQTGNRAYVDIADTTFSNVTTSAQGCLIYNSTNGNKAIAVIAFGGSGISASSGDLTIQFPAVGTNGANAIIRIE